MTGNAQPSPEQTPPTTITQKARDRATQIAQLYGDYIQNSNKFYLLSTTSVLVVLLAVVLGWGAPALYRTWAGRPPPMTGEFNIAVAEFAQIPEAAHPGQQIAPIASQKIYDFLEAEYRITQFGTGVAVSHDSRFGVIVDEQAAAQLAEQVGADLVVYGNVTVVGDDAAINIQFYVGDSYRADTSELSGLHKLALPPFKRAELIQSDSQVSTLLRDRTALFVEFTKGLAYLATDDLERAQASASRALAHADRFPGLEGQEVLYLLRARILRLQEDYDGAQADVDAILALNPTYGRAYIAQGNIYFMRDELDLAQETYEQALALEGQRSEIYLDERAHMGLGNIYLKRFLLAPEVEKRALGEEALGYYEKVIASYERIPAARQGKTLREVAAWSYGYSGVIYHTWQEWDIAADRYRTALELSDDEQLQQLFAPELEKLE